MNDYEFFELAVAEGVARITLDRPPLNVLHIPMMAEFNQLLESVVADTGLAAILVAAKGKAFSAGVDVTDHTADKVVDMIQHFHGIFRKLAATDALTIAAVRGAALGGGCELATFCDIVLASDRAKFGQPEVQVGVLPPVAACVLPLQIGLKKAVEINALGVTLKATDALAIGLVNHVYPDAEFDAAVAGWVKDIQKLSRPVVRLAKRATCLVAREQILAHLDRVERMYLNELMTLADAHEGLEAFLEKRAPMWSHA